ncbi:hypothetical protein Rs2_01973 [Raphanus sativus]|nr:hypothetical protein Rs2_01973 [Raphanus sativus]
MWSALLSIGVALVSYGTSYYPKSKMAVSARASRQARMLRRSTKPQQTIPDANKQLMKKRGGGRPCIISEASVSANALLDDNHRPWLSLTYLSKLDTLQTIPK